MDSNNIFQQIRSHITLTEVIRSYGLEITRNNMMICPFHSEKTPSLKIYENTYKCFGCGASGDTVSFISKLFGISMYEAACKINSDFSLNLNTENIISDTSYEDNRIKQQELKDTVLESWNVVCKYFNSLYVWNKEFAPKNSGDPLHPLFAESIQKLDFVEYLCECFNNASSLDERIQLVDNYKREIMVYKERLDETEKGP